MNILITGASGYIGSQLVHLLRKKNEELTQPSKIIATDLRETPAYDLDEFTEHVRMDVRSEDISVLMKEKAIDTVVHLATIVTPGKKSNREFEYSVDVLGTENVLQACVESNVKRIIISSSGAAYGYHADNPEWINEDTALRGNEEFAYSDHKRIVEEMLEMYREKHPGLEQVIFRIGAILGKGVDNQITKLFEKRYLLGITGSDSPFVFIWDEDVIGCMVKGIYGEEVGIYNVAGDGTLTIDQIAEKLNKKVVRIPAWLIKGTLFILKRLRLTQYGEEQVNFLRYRPVLLNERLKNEFDYIPTYTTEEVFDMVMNHKKTWKSG